MRWIKTFFRNYKLNQILKYFEFDRDDRFENNNREKIARDAITFWFENLEKEEFDQLSKVLKNFTYYSGTKVGEVFDTWGSNNEVRKMINPNETVFMPLKKHNNRTETSIGISLKFYNVFGIDSTSTALENSDIWLKNYVTYLIPEYNKLKIKKEEVENLINKNNNEINELQKKIESGNLSKGEQDECRSQKQEKKNICKKAKSNLNMLFNESKIYKSHKHDFASTNVVIIDDFLCSGTSLVNFLKNTEEYILKIDKQIYFVFLEATEKGLQKVYSDSIYKSLEEKIKIIPIRKSIDYRKNILVDKEVNDFDKIIGRVYQKFEIEDDIHYEVKTVLASFMNAPNTNYGFLSNIKVNSKWKYPFPRSKR